MATGAASAGDDDVAAKRGQRIVKLRHKMMAAGALTSATRQTVRATIRDHQRERRSKRVSVWDHEKQAYDPLGSPLGEPGEAGRMAPAEGYAAEQFSALCGLFSGWLNVLLIFIPIGQLCHIFIPPGLPSRPVIVFSTNFLAIVPLASLLGGATEALSEHTGQLLGGLLNATFGNVVEMIMCIQSVRAGLISVVKGNLLGSILSNLLLVLGMALVASGFKRKVASFNSQGAAANMTCQLVASISVCLPTVYETVHGATGEEVLQISRICSLLLMSLYGLFLFFMLQTHSELFADEGTEEESGQGLSPWLCVALLIILTLMVERSSDALVSVIEEFSDTCGVSKAFIGVILLPIVGNAAEHATAVTAAYNGMIDLALGVAVGSSTQIALFVVPVAVIFGWIQRQTPPNAMDLHFTIFDTVCQMLTVFLVSQVLQHGTTNWLHGAMLMSVYFFIAIETLYIMEPVQA